MLANQLRLWRLSLGFKQQELAAQAGVSPAQIVAIERYYHLPGPEVRAKLAAALGVSELQLWPGLIKAEVQGCRTNLN